MGRTFRVPVAWRMLLVLLVAYAASAFVYRSLAPLAPFLERDWSLSVTQVGLLQSAAFLGMTLGSIPLGRATDRIGVRRMLLVTLAGLAGAFLLLVQVNLYATAVAFLMVAGACQGALHSLTNKGILDWFAPGQRGLAGGIKQASVNVGSAAIALVLPPLALLWGWRTAMTTLLLIVLGLALAAFLVYRDPEAPAAGRGVAATSLADLLRLKPLWLLSGTAFLMVAVQGATGSYLTLTLTRSHGFPEVTAGWYLALAELWGTIGRIGWGLIGDRWFLGRRERILQAMAILGTVGTLGLAWSQPGAPSIQLVISVSLLGLSTLAFHGMWMTLASEIGREAAAATATGVSLTVGSLGIVIGTPLVGAVIDYTGSYQAGWLACAALTLAQLVLLAGRQLDPEARGMRTSVPRIS